MLAILPITTFAIETGPIEIEPGFEDEQTGIRLESVKTETGSDTQIVTIAVPKSSIDDTGIIEEIVVIGKRPKKPSFKIPFTYEWADDFENDYFGLIIKFSKDVKYPIRIFFYSDDGQEITP